MMNIFLGVPISEQISLHWNQLIYELHPNWQNHSALNWTAAQNHHLTLHFFGAIDLKKLDNFRENLPTYLKECQKFIVFSNQVSNFPKARANLLAAYVELSLPLAQLYQLIQKAVMKYQLPTETRPYFPHVTLLRSKRKGLLDMQPILVRDPILIHELILFQTQSKRGGNVYLPLERWLLK